jgi:hypothetical protein
MKNIHILPTDKPTWLHKSLLSGVLRKSSNCINDMKQAQGFHIYITSDEEIKEGDYFWKPDCNMIFKAEYTPHKGCKKIILTTDRDLIKDGVQGIDDEFLEWFVKNPSCEFVEIVEELKYFNLDELRERHLKGLPHIYSEKIGYKIIIPKEEPKQETLEEAFEKWSSEQSGYNKLDVLRFGAKWQAERSYSEEEVEKIAIKIYNKLVKHDAITLSTFKEWFEQFKKK